MKQHLLHDSRKKFDKQKKAQYPLEKLNLSRDQLSTVYPNQHADDSSLRNISNWWNIDPILTPKDTNHHHHSQENKPRQHKSMNIMRNDINILDARKHTLSTIPASDQMLTPTLSSERETKQVSQISMVKKSSGSVSKEPSRQTVIEHQSRTSHKIERDSYKEPNQRNSSKSVSKRVSYKDNEGFVFEKENDRSLLHQKSEKILQRRTHVYEQDHHVELPEKKKEEDRLNTRISINIELLKNLNASNNDSLFSCRIDFTNDPTKTEMINLYSPFVEIKDRAVKLNFLGEVDLDLDTILASFKSRPLRIYSFQKMALNHQELLNKDATNVKVYGLSEIDLSLMLLNPNDLLLNPDRPKVLSGWYHIADTDDNYRILGQMKIEVKIQISKATQKKLQSVSKNRSIVDVQPTYSDKLEANIREIQKSRSSVELRDRVNPVQVDKTVYHDYSVIKPKHTKASASRVLDNELTTYNAFDAIHKDLENLNMEVKKKEYEYEKATKNDAPFDTRVDADFAFTLQKLRQILMEDD